MKQNARPAAAGYWYSVRVGSGYILKRGSRADDPRSRLALWSAPSPL